MQCRTTLHTSWRRPYTRVSLSIEIMIHHPPPGRLQSTVTQFTWSLIHSFKLTSSPSWGVCHAMQRNSNPVIITPLMWVLLPPPPHLCCFSPHFPFLARAFIHQCTIKKDQHGNYFPPSAHLRIPRRKGTENRVRTVKIPFTLCRRAIHPSLARRTESPTSDRIVWSSKSKDVNNRLTMQSALHLHY